MLDSARLHAIVAQVIRSEGATQLIDTFFESGLFDTVVDRLLVSDGLWRLIDEVASSPAVMEAVSQQGLGFADQLGDVVRERSRNGDRRVERVADRLMRRDRTASRRTPTQDGEDAPGKSRQTRSMRTTVEQPRSDTTLKTTLDDNLPYVGLVTRAISWCVDFLIINLVAIISGLGIQLVASIFPITKDLKPLFVAIAGSVYVLWTAAYFVVLWSITGQTIGSRLLQVRLVTPSRGKVKPVRGLVRWVAMSLAMVPLPWGYLPIPLKRLGIPDWLAHTRVIETEQLSIAEARQERKRQARDNSRQPPSPLSLKNPHAPPDPSYMPQYRIPQQAVGLALSAQAEAHFSGGESAAGTADKSVRLTVFLAAVLFLVGIGSRS